MLLAVREQVEKLEASLAHVDRLRDDYVARYNETQKNAHSIQDTITYRKFLEHLRGLRARGQTVLLITHKLKEILALCDRVTVMRGGEVVLEREIAQTSVDDLAHAMVGRRVATGRRTPTSEEQGPAAAVRPTLLQAQGLRWTDAFGVARLDDVSLELKAGEIVGVAGVTGNGQTELLEVLSGLKVPQSGTLVLAGDTFVPSAWLSPAQARQRRLAHVPEDRLHRALILPFAAWESAVLGYQGWRRYGRWAWMNRVWAASRAMAQAAVALSGEAISACNSGERTGSIERRRCSRSVS